MYASEKQELFEFLRDPQTRHAYVDSTIRQYLALKVKSLRKARCWSQEELGRLAGDMKQSRISRLEDPRYSGVTLATLKRLAKAFDVALLVDLVPFTELVERTIERTEKQFAPLGYEEERQAGATFSSAATHSWGLFGTHIAQSGAAVPIESVGIEHWLWRGFSLADSSNWPRLEIQHAKKAEERELAFAA